MMIRITSLLALSLVLGASGVAHADTFTDLGLIPTADYGTLVAGSQSSGSVGPTASSFEPHPYIADYTEGIYVGGSGSLCANCLAFVFSFSNAQTTGADGIELFTDTSFNGYNVAAGYVGVAGGLAPSSIADNSGTINYAFNASSTSGSVLPGDQSDTLVIFTNATNYQPGGMGFLDGQSVNAPGLMPAAATPEPSSLILLGTGIIGLAGAARRKLVRS